MTWKFQSSSNPNETYTVILDAGALRCNCRGWTMKRNGQPRHCKHTKHVVEREGLKVEVRGDYVFPVGDIPTTMKPPVAPVAKVSSDMTVPAPMLASAMTTPVAGDAFDALYGTGEWLMEEKLDGHRCTIRVAGGEVFGWSRPRAGKQALARVLPLHIVQTAKHLPDGVYDGELRVPGGKAWDVTSDLGSLVLTLFDVLELGGVSVMGKPYGERRVLLAKAVDTVKDKSGGTCNIVSMTAIYKVSWATVEAFWSLDKEGAILKKVNSAYRPGYRTPDWVKVVPTRTVAMTITGYTAGKNGPCSTIELEGVDGAITSVKTLDNATLRLLEASPASYVGKKLVIKYRERTPDGKYRHPMWDHFAGEGE